MFQVQVSPRDGQRGAACHPPADLARFAKTATLLESSARHALAEEFDAIAARPEMLRECDETGRLHLRDVSAQDGLLLDCCGPTWQLAARVVGDAMGRCEQGDAFLNSRLQVLMDSNHIEADGPPIGLRTYRVRRSTKSESNL